MRLQKMPIFTDKKAKHFLQEHTSFKMILGDTLVAPPPIIYLPAKKDSFTRLVNEDWEYSYAEKTQGRASLQFDTPKDSILKYVVLMADNDSVKPFVLRYRQNIRNLAPGKYDLVLLLLQNFMCLLLPLFY